MISPCSKMSYRNWHSEGYEAVANYAAEHHGLKVVLTGGPSEIDKYYAQAIHQRANSEVIDLIGKISLKELLAILDEARLVITPTPARHTWPRQ